MEQDLSIYSKDMLVLEASGSGSISFPEKLQMLLSQCRLAAACSCVATTCYSSCHACQNGISKTIYFSDSDVAKSMLQLCACYSSCHACRNGTSKINIQASFILVKMLT